MQTPQDAAMILMNIEHTIKKYGMLAGGTRVLCAVSGGADSVCLLSLMRQAAPRLGVEIACAHFNHMLRGAEADRDEQFVKDLCAEWGVEFAAGRADVGAYARENGMGIEEAARVLRYRFLEETADRLGCARIATAHNANDNAETVLMNLARGSGAKGLCGIPPVRGRMIRPLIETGRGEIEAYLESMGISHVEDSTNHTDEHTRNVIRHNILPRLVEINSGCVANISRMSALLRADEEALDAQAEEFIAREPGDGAVSVKRLRELPVPTAARVFRRLWSKSLSQAHVAALLALCEDGKSGACADIPGGRVVREFDRLVFSAGATGRIESAVITEGETRDIGCGLTVTCEIVENPIEVNSSLNTFFFKYENICGKIIVRPREGGDSIRLAGRGCTKSLKKLFAEAGIPAGERDGIPVIADEAGPVGIYGFGTAERCAPQPGCRAVKIEFRGRNA